MGGTAREESLDALLARLTVDEARTVPKATGALAAWGRFVHRNRRLALALSALLLVASIAVVAMGGTLATKGPRDTESGRALALVEEQVPLAAGGSFVLLFEHPTLSASDAAFRDAMETALAPLRADPRVALVLSPATAPPEAAPRLVSHDGRSAIAIVRLFEPRDAAMDDYDALRALVAAGDFDVRATGELAFQHDLERQLERDLLRSEVFTVPVTLVLLVLVFGSAFAALLPLGVGALAVLGGVAGVLLLSRVADVSQYAINITTLIGLGVAIDYSLFVVSRFREETRRHVPTEEALARTMKTAGHAVLYSGVTVAIGLSGLLFFKGTFLASMGLAGTIVVALAVVYALTFLPALLGVLGDRVAKWDLPKLARARRPRSRRFWHALAEGVMARPVAVLAPVLAILLVAGAPFLHMRLAAGGPAVLPEDAEARAAHETLVASFPGMDLARVPVVVAFPGGDPLSPERAAAIADYSARLRAIPGVAAVESVVDRNARPETSVGERVVIVTALVAAPPPSDAARDVVRAIRDATAPADGEALVMGETAADLDFIALVAERAPIAIAFVVVVTYALLFAQVRSVLIPLKALVMNLLSMTASFGALVWVFQDGHLSGVLGFTPQAIDPTLPVILFCAVFGLSMDYEVLLLSRMKEEHDKTGDNRKAVAEGLEASGRLVTGAALIMVVVFGSFALADVVVLKAVGLGLAIAVAVDATLVRALLVPATMRLLGEANWWAPRWARRGADRAPEGEAPEPAPIAPRAGEGA